MKIKNKYLVYGVATIAGMVLGGLVAGLHKKKNYVETDLGQYRRGGYIEPVGQKLYNTIAENQHPVDDEPEEEEEEEDEELERAVDDDEEKAREAKRPPRIISIDAIDELDSTWSREVLYFYVYDNVLVTEDDEEPIEGAVRKRTVGTTLEKYNFVNNQEAVIFVQNFEFSTVYEIEKVWGSFKE